MRNKLYLFSYISVLVLVSVVSGVVVVVVAVVVVVSCHYKPFSLCFLLLRLFAFRIVVTFTGNLNFQQHVLT